MIYATVAMALLAPMESHAIERLWPINLNNSTHHFTICVLSQIANP